MVYPHAMSHSVPHVFSHVQAFGRTGFRASDVPQSEATILIELYGDTAGGAWTDNTSWKTKATVNDWYGITVGSGHVTGIDLSSNNLVGIIPASLGSLSEVTAIDLSGNTLTGVDAFVVALAASVASNPRAGTLNISGANMEELTYGTEGSPSDSAEAVMSLLTAEWVVTVQGTVPAWVYSTEVVVAGVVKLATEDTGAMAFGTGLDWSGIAAGSLVRMTDDEDNKVEGYVWKSGGGKLLGAELVTNGSMEDLDGGTVPDPPVGYSLGANVTWESTDVDPYAGSISGKITSTAETIRVVDTNTFSVSDGALYDYAHAAKAQAGETVFTQIRSGATTVIQERTTSTSWVLYSGAFTCSNTSLYVRHYVNSASGYGFIDGITFKKYTDVPATGIHFESSPGEADGTLSLKETGFDPNAIVKVEFIGVP